MWMLWNIESSCEVHAEHESKHRSFMDSSFEIFLSSEFLLLKDQDYIKMLSFPWEIMISCLDGKYSHLLWKVTGQMLSTSCNFTKKFDRSLQLFFFCLCWAFFVVLEVDGKVQAVAQGLVRALEDWLFCSPRLQPVKGMCCAVLELALRAPPHVALAAGLGIAGIVSPDPREKKSRTGLIPCKGIFFNVFFTEARQKQTDSNSLSCYPGEVILSHRRRKKIPKSRVNGDEAIKKNGN